MGKESTRIADLAVEAEQASDVKGGTVPDAPDLSAQYLSAGVIKGFNPQPDPPKTL
jgi:hypothetical protein